MADPVTLTFAQQLLSVSSLIGIIGNLTASFLWEGGKWVGKPILDKLPSIAELFARGGSTNNHDLLRALRRAECRAVVALCDQALRDNFGLRIGSISDRIESLLRSDPEVKALSRIRQCFAQTYDDLGSMPIEQLARLHGSSVRDVPALVKTGAECFNVTSAERLRESIVGQQVTALDGVVRLSPAAAGLSGADLRPLAMNGLPASLKQRMEQHPQGWWDMLRLAFREELKDPANQRAQIAWQMDVLSALPEQLGGNYEEFAKKFDSLDANLAGMWNEVTAFRQAFDSAIAGVTEYLDDIQTTTHSIDTKVDALHVRFGEVIDAAKHRPQPPPFELPKRALAGKLFGRER